MTAIVLPNRRDEAWKYSDLRAAFGDAPAPVAQPALADRPVIVQLASAARTYDRTELAVGENAARIERLEGEGPSASALELIIPDGASMTRVVLQDGDAVTLNHVRVRLGAGAHYRQFVLAFGAKLARIETEVHVDGEGGVVELNGVYLADHGRHADFTSHVVHHIGRGQTRQLVRGAARAGGRGVFQGKILVAKDAQKTDAEQHHDALLLDEGAEIYAKPELEIYADDVSCAHGNTAGALDEKALFYMRARGIPKATAQALLTQAFVRAAVPDWLPDALGEEVDARIAAWLGMAP